MYKSVHLFLEISLCKNYYYIIDSLLYISFFNTNCQRLSNLIFGLKFLKEDTP